MRKVLLIGHASEFQLATTMLLEKMPDIEIITHEEAERQRLTTNKSFEPEPFVIKNYHRVPPKVIYESKFGAPKELSKRAKRRKDARNARRHF